MKRFALMTLVAAATLTGCKNDSSEKEGVETLQKKEVSFDSLPGFAQSDLQAAAVSFQRSCEKVLDPKIRPLVKERSVQGENWYGVCKAYLENPAKTSDDFKKFLKKHFTVFKASTVEKETGLLTGYFRPELKVSHKKSTDYLYPVYRKPPGLQVIEDLAPFNQKATGIRIAYRLEGDVIKPYFTRQEIENDALANKNLEIAWAKDAYDLFFMHIQGSGRLVFEDGRHLDVGYGGTNGYEYTSIGKVLIEQQVLKPEDVSMESIKQWMRDNPKEAVLLMQQNRSYVFFKEIDSMVDMPIGSQHVELTTLASAATDPRYIPLGTPVWLDAPQTIQSLVIAQDVGGAIKGPLRADLFCGSGPKAGSLAGPLKDRCTFYLLHPKEQ